MLCDFFIISINDDSILRKLLTESDPNLAKVMEIATVCMQTAESLRVISHKWRHSGGLQTRADLLTVSGGLSLLATAVGFSIRGTGSGRSSGTLMGEKLSWGNTSGSNTGGVNTGVGDKGTWAGSMFGSPWHNLSWSTCLRVHLPSKKGCCTPACIYWREHTPRRWFLSLAQLT